MKITLPPENTGPVWHRYSTVAGAKAKVRAWLQRRVWGFWFNWIPVANYERQLEAEIVTLVAALQDAMEEYEKNAKDLEKKVIQWVEENSVRDSVSSKFRGHRLKRQVPIAQDEAVFKEAYKLAQRIMPGAVDLSRTRRQPREKQKGETRVGVRLDSVDVDDSHLNRVFREHDLDTLIGVSPEKPQNQQQSNRQKNRQQNNQNNSQDGSGN